jgi:ferrous iron transport protein B
MPTSLRETHVRHVALIGNPNTGKSTLFNALSGLHQRVGNYPGVTVEKRTGEWRVDGRSFVLIDLPGTYSLVPRSPDEVVTVDVLMGRQADLPAVEAVVCVVDASNLARNLYLVTQILQLGLPTVVALNMLDVARDKGVDVDAARLATALSVPVVEINAQRQTGVDRLWQAVDDAQPAHVEDLVFLPREMSEAYRKSAHEIAAAGLNPFLIERLLLDDAPYLTEAMQTSLPPDVQRMMVGLRATACPVQTSLPEDEAQLRYRWIEQRLQGVTRRTAAKSPWTDRLDHLLLHPILGLGVAAVALLVLFQAVYAVAEPASFVIDTFKGTVAHGIRWAMPDGALRSLLTDGILEGVGGVLVFIPQIFLLFFFIAVLEDTGYLSRVACLMDRVMSRMGLSGKSFIPLLSSFACAIPGIMAARVIDNRRDRIVTMLIAPLMSCSARIPIYVLMTSAFISERRLFAATPGLRYLTEIPVLGRLFDIRGLATFAMYLLGIAVAVVMAWVLKRTLLRGSTPPFLLELPTYKWPSLIVVLRRMWQGGWSFIEGAGTLIVAVTILVWAAAYFPHGDQYVDSALLAERARLTTELDRETASLPAPVAAHPRSRIADRAEPLARLEAELGAIENRIQSSRLKASLLGRAGRRIEPLVRPLGWDWRIGCAVIASFPAREVVVATLGVIYGLGDAQDESSESLQTTLQTATWDGTDRLVFSTPVALSLMVFFALCAQCTSTLAIMRRETNSWRWPAFTFAYMTSLAYLGALLTFHSSRWLLS